MIPFRRRHRRPDLWQFSRFNPHCHILVTDGCFYGGRGMFRVAPLLELKKLEAIFRHKALRMLLSRVRLPGRWRGCSPMETYGVQRLREKPYFTERRYGHGNPGPLYHPASFTQKRMQYLEQAGTTMRPHSRSAGG